MSCVRNDVVIDTHKQQCVYLFLRTSFPFSPAKSSVLASPRLRRCWMWLWHRRRPRQRLTQAGQGLGIMLDLGTDNKRTYSQFSRAALQDAIISAWQSPAFFQVHTDVYFHHHTSAAGTKRLMNFVVYSTKPKQKDISNQTHKGNSARPQLGL